MDAPPRRPLSRWGSLAEAAIAWVESDSEDDEQERKNAARLRNAALAMSRDGLLSQLSKKELLKEYGRKGGVARALALNPARRSMIARRAAKARHRKGRG